MLIRPNEKKLSQAYRKRRFSSQRLNFSTTQLVSRRPAVGSSAWLGRMGSIDVRVSIQENISKPYAVFQA
jgi:hypothetical protein